MWEGRSPAVGRRGDSGALVCKVLKINPRSPWRLQGAIGHLPRRDASIEWTSL